jgi:hypothetical protein
MSGQLTGAPSGVLGAGNATLINDPRNAEYPSNNKLYRQPYATPEAATAIRPQSRMHYSHTDP